MESDKQRSEIILIFLSKYIIKDDYKNCFILQFRKHIFFGRFSDDSNFGRLFNLLGINQLVNDHSLFFGIYKCIN